MTAATRQSRRSTQADHAAQSAREDALLLSEGYLQEEKTWRMILKTHQRNVAGQLPQGHQTHVHGSGVEHLLFHTNACICVSEAGLFSVFKFLPFRPIRAEGIESRV